MDSMSTLESLGSAEVEPAAATAPEAVDRNNNQITTTAEFSDNLSVPGLVRLRLLCGAIVNHTWVQHFITFLTVVNAKFLIIFTIELGMQLKMDGWFSILSLL